MTDDHTELSNRPTTFIIDRDGVIRYERRAKTFSDRPTPDEILAELQKLRTGRPIVAFVTSSHCGYCRKMERESWSDARVVSAIRSDLVPLRIDAERQPQLVERLRIRAFPTTLLFTPEGRLIDRVEGDVPPGTLLASLVRIGAEAQAANGVGR